MMRNGTFPFMMLPLEIRWRIYQYLVTELRTREDTGIVDLQVIKPNKIVS